MAKKRLTGRYITRVFHGSTDSHDLCLCTRKPLSLTLKDLPVLWGGKPDEGQERVSTFLLYNRKSFDFLSIKAKLAEDGTSSIIFQPSEKVGCAPLFSPVNGKVCATIIVSGNMNEDISEVLPLIEEELLVDFSPKLVLPYKTSIKPPLYFECAKFIDQYIKCKKLHWQKFISEVKIEKLPSSSTQWHKYAVKSYDPHEVLKYPNKKNYLSTNHSEWRELNYVLKNCLDELCSLNTPRISRLAYRTKVEDLRRSIDFRNIIKPTELRTHSADPIEIKKLKEIGNRIINAVLSEYRAWNLDFSRLFEGYVQYIFKNIAKLIGARSLSNNKFNITGNQTEWSLSYLEPDIIVLKRDMMIIADAKYKMHMYNLKSENVNVLRDTFRHDLHQVLAYSSFEKEYSKTAILVYPSNKFKCFRQKISPSLSNCSTNVYLVGIPWGNCQTSDNSVPLTIQNKLKLAIDGLYDNIFKDLPM